MSDELLTEEIATLIIDVCTENRKITGFEILETTPKYLAVQIIAKLQSKGWLSPEQMKAEGWVELDSDQSLPENPYVRGYNTAYYHAQQTMLNTNFRRIK